jgi:tRNA(Ile)-lysidine synthase
MARSAKKIDEISHLLAHWLGTLTPNSKLCVAFSGGVDSSVLLHALVQVRAGDAAFAHLQISAVHIHHGLSANADDWAMHCEDVARTLNIACDVIRVQVCDTDQLGIEAAARNARYAALTEHAKSKNAIIALAHHARDQAETVLLQLLRGAGPAGLSAMPDAASPFVRPLLNVEKSSINEFALKANLKHIVDESNADTRFSRNRLRHAVWPELVRAFPSAERTLARAARWQQENSELAHELALMDLSCCEKAGAIVANVWRELSSTRRRNVLRHWLATLHIATPSSERLLEWERQLLTQNETQNVLLSHASFVGSIRLYRGHIYYVAPAHTEHGALAVGTRWLGEDIVLFGKGAVHFRAATEANSGSNTRHLRPMKHGESWVIRSRREGDSIVLSPNSGGVSMKKIFQKADVAPWLRAAWPILTCNGVIAAVPGIAIAGEYQTSDGDGLVLEWSDRRPMNGRIA